MSLLRLTQGIQKPHLKYDSDRQQWICHDDYYVFGYGASVKEAYLNWGKKSKRLVIIPRKSIWNIQSCMEWWLAGCQRMRTGVDIEGECRWIWGYSPTTDELILRG